MPAMVAPNAAASSTDAVSGPTMGSLVNSTSGMPSYVQPIGRGIPYSASEVSSSHAGMTAKSSVMAQLPALTDANGDQVLNNGEGEYLFILDGQDTLRRDTTLGAVHVYTLAGINALLAKHAKEESRLMRDIFEGTAADRQRRMRQSRAFITTPGDFRQRIKFFGVQLSSTETTQGANWQLQKKAGVTVFPVIAEGRSPVANLWGTVTEGSKVGFLVRAFPDNEIAGTKSALLNRAPLQVVPVVKCCGAGVPSNPSFGTPFVPRNNASSSSSSRKRPRYTIADAIREHEMIKHTMHGEVPRRRAEQECERASLASSRRTVRHASTISDAKQLERLTNTYSIYGLEARDASNPTAINPEGMYACYEDTVWQGEVAIGNDGTRAHRFSRERTHGLFLPVGFVQSPALGGLPPEASIRRAVYDPSGHGFHAHRDKYKVYLQVRT